MITVSVYFQLKSGIFFEFDDLVITVNKDYRMKGWISARIAGYLTTGRTTYDDVL
jgi:hypothetical protein